MALSAFKNRFVFYRFLNLYQYVFRENSYTSTFVLDYRAVNVLHSRKKPQPVVRNQTPKRIGSSLGDMLRFLPVVWQENEVFWLCF